ncbi:MAG: glutamine-hydrolyzing GMP synthase, partial [Calditrichaceae bacterium]
MEPKTLINEKLHETILILDFGSQYTQLIARRVRELNVFSEIQPFNYDLSLLKDQNIKGIILSGGPSSVYEDNAPRVGSDVLNLGIPLLGICYGLQLLTYLSGGEIAPAEHKEYGLANLNIINGSGLLGDISNTTNVWMSHGDKVTKLPPDFETIAKTVNSPYAAIKHKNMDVFGIQFHPEVVHTVEGKQILSNFLFDICKCKGDWSPQSFIEESIKAIRQKIGDKHVLCAMSGGVDSSVVAVLLHKAVGKQLHCIFIDTGLLRLNEAKDVEEVFRKNFDIDLTCINSSDSFYSKLHGVQE